MKEIDRDIDGMASETKATLNGQLFPADKVTLDEKGKSFVYDFKEEKEIQKIELFKTNLERKSRIRERDLHIYTKQNAEDGWEELTPDGWNYVVDSRNQSIHFNLKNALKTRFIKIRTIWDDRDIDNNNVCDYVTFSNDSVQKMIRIWTLDDKRNEAYSYDNNSNRVSLTENGKNRNYTYYKNAEDGNTARVMSDGKWWYTYDENGNRTARGYNENPDSGEVSIDKTREYWTYTWDLWNRLVKVEQHNAPDNVENVYVEYTYDVFNHRIERVSKTKTAEETTQYAYGRNGVLTYQKKTSGSSVTTRSFVYLNNQIAGFMDTENSTESIRFAVTDIQGSVTEVYDEDNKLLWKSGYTAFGIKAGETTNLLDFDGLYTGCDYDAETGLSYHWKRWRSEDGDSWLSEDPARDGMNWYGYVGQNPVVNVDPIGLFYYTGPTGSSQASSSTPTLHEPTGPTGPSEPTETQKIPETQKQPNTVQFNDLNKDNNIVTLTPDPDYLITKNKTTKLISLKQKFQRALSKNASFNKPGKNCDTYCTKLYDDMDNKPSDWPSPDEYSVGPSSGNKKNYIDYYKNKTKKAPEDGISSVFMDGGKYVGQPHDVTIFKDSDGTIIKTEYTTVNGKRRVVTETYQNQKAFESAYGYKDFYYLSIEVVR